MRQVDTSIWETTQPLKLGGVLELGHRMTVIRLPDTRLVVHSPVQLTSAIKQDLESLGTPALFIAPNFLHDLYWDDYFREYPDATFLAPKGMTLKQTFLPLNGGTELPSQVQVLPVNGMPLVQEWALYHPESRSLVVADLAFNLSPASSMMGRTAQRMAGIYDSFGPSRLFRFLIKDRGQFAASMAPILELDFERILMGHGEIHAQDSREALLQALQQHQLAPT